MPTQQSLLQLEEQADGAPDGAAGQRCVFQALAAYPGGHRRGCDCLKDQCTPPRSHLGTHLNGLFFSFLPGFAESKVKLRSGCGFLSASGQASKAANHGCGSGLTSNTHRQKDPESEHCWYLTAVKRLLGQSSLPRCCPPTPSRCSSLPVRLA